MVGSPTLRWKSRAQAVDTISETMKMLLIITTFASNNPECSMQAPWLALLCAAVEAGLAETKVLEVFTKPGTEFWTREMEPLTPVMLGARQAMVRNHPDEETKARSATQLALSAVQTALDALNELDPDKTPVKAMLALKDKVNELVKTAGGKVSKVSVTETE